MRKRFGKIICMLPFLVSLGATAGEIKGVVTDPEKANEPVAGAVVIARSAALPAGVNALTEEDGRFSFTNLADGTYTVTADFAGAMAEQTVVVAGAKAIEVALKVAISKAKVASYEITGTRLRTPNQKEVSPVASIGQADIQIQGTTKIEDVINSLPQAFTAQGSTISNGSNGTAQVNLRGLGAPRSLVLVNGRRLGPGNPSSGAAVVGDLNFIPSSLVERIDVLTGGASAVYGADAVAGVVNFIMKKDFQGVQLDLNWGAYGHHQQNTELQQMISDKRDSVAEANKQFFNVPGDVWNVMGPSISLTLGANTPDGKGNVTAYGSYRLDYPILQADRDFSSCALNSGDVFSCGGSGTSSPARVGGFIVEGDTFRPRNAATDVYNFGPTNYFQRPDERYNLGAFAHYKAASWADVYGEVMYLDDRSVAQIAPGGIFVGRRTINCDNPFMTDAQAAQLGCAPDRSGNFVGNVAKRNVEGGGRQDMQHHSSYRLVGGIKGDFATNWNYDAYFQYMATDFSRSSNNYFHSTRIDRALIAKPDPANPGQVVCQSVIDGTDPACVPYNIFEEGQITQAMLNYLQVPGYDGGYASERVVNASVSGDLGAYGARSPFSKDGIKINMGGEYRHQTVSFYSDFLLQSGLLSGRGAASLPINNGFYVLEAFGETRIPIVQDKFLAKNLQAEFAYRYSNYTFGKDTHTFKAGGEWEFLDDMRIRASYQRAVRAPSIAELYQPRVVGLDGATDPCAGLTAGDPLVATCMEAFNLSEAQVLAIEANPANQYNGLLGGNTNLDPELSDTVSVGFVVQPRFVPGLALSVDYFNIKIDKFISVYGADTILANCLDTLDPAFCDLVHRDAEGSLFLSTDGYVIDTNFNLGGQRTDGIDFNLAYVLPFSRLGIQNLGTLSFEMNGTWLGTLITQNLPGGPAYDCTGLYGVICGGPAPEWRHKMRLTWDMPFGLSVAAQWRFLNAVSLEAASGESSLEAPDRVFATDLTLASRSYLDVFASYKVKDMFTFRMGVNNLIDTDPPLAGQTNVTIGGGGNGNTFPQVYDARGRYLYLSATANF